MGVVVQSRLEAGVEEKKKAHIIICNFGGSEAHLVSWLLFLLPDLVYMDFAVSQQKS